jgi:hypothetical protein
VEMLTYYVGAGAAIRWGFHFRLSGPTRVCTYYNYQIYLSSYLSQFNWLEFEL